MSHMAMMSVDKGPDGVAVLRWNCVDLPVNAFHEASTAEFIETMCGLLADPALKGVVITSAKADFHSGADLGMLQRLFDAPPEQTLRDVRRVTQLLRQMECSGKVLVSAIGGHALGGGLEMALACHARLVADVESIKIGLPEVKLGLMPGFGGTQRLARLIGAQAALRLIGDGRTLSPQAALKQGIVTALVPASELIERARLWIHPKSGSYPIAASAGGGVGGPMTGAMRSLM